jgi:hypothetical protein
MKCSANEDANNDDIDNPRSCASLCKHAETEQCSVTPMKWLLFPYMIGLLWLLLHPIVSVTTGELKCRGFFVDEKALLHSTYYSAPYPFDQLWRYYSDKNRPTDGLCHNLRALDMLETSMIECHQDKTNNFDYAIIVPNKAPSLPSEAIVLIVKEPNCQAGWTSSYFHVALLNLIHRLSDGVSSPWLSKNIIIVSPRPTLPCKSKSVEDFSQLHATVTAFADAYHLGSLPMKHITSVIRNVLVLDVEQIMVPSESTKSSIDVFILPQGVGAVLPNFDLVSVMVEIFLHQNWSLTQNLRVNLHPSVALIRKIQIVLEKNFPSAVAAYFKDLISMFAFVGFLSLGP